MEQEKLGNIWKNPDGTFKKGHPGIGGRPKGKTLKEYAREYLMSLPDEQKTEYLASLPPELVWRMAEGQPKQETDNNHSGEMVVVLPATLISKNDTTPNTGDSGLGQAQI